MCDKDRGRHGALKPMVLALFAAVAVVLLLSAAAMAGVSPAITSASHYTFYAGVDDTFDITTDGFAGTKKIIECAGFLPYGLSFYNDVDSGTAKISGAAYTGQPGDYSLTITVWNDFEQQVTQEFTLTVYEEAPALSCPDNGAFVVGTWGWLDMAATGVPTPSFGYRGTLPSGLYFADGSNGTAQIYGSPDAGAAGLYSITVTAGNGVSTVEQDIGLTVNEAPTITSEDYVRFGVDCPSYFTVTTNGFPTPVIDCTGTLPNGIYFYYSGGGTASIGGTPDHQAAAGDYHITLTASNGIGLDAIQDFTVTIYDQAPTFTDTAYCATFTVGDNDGWFFAYANGYPFPRITCDAPPAGLYFADDTNGCAHILGTPAAGTGGLYSLTITATNRVGSDTREVALIVNEAPAVTNLDNATFIEGVPGEFTFTTTGYPKPGIASVGSLPNGVSLVDNGDGTATLSGTPAALTAGDYPLDYHTAITATNGVDPAATQDFTLTVNPLPTISSDDHCTFTVGTEGTFDVVYIHAWGIVCSGDLPSGVIFNGFLDDTIGRFRGTPDPGTGGVYNVTLTTSGPYLPVTQAFTLTVNEAVAITTHPTDRTVNAGQTASFSASATGYPLPTVQWQVSSDGGSSWSDIAGAIDTTYSTGATSSGMNGYQYRAVFSNGVGDPVYSNAALLTVPSTLPKAPVISQQPTNQTVLFGRTATFTAAADGNPAPTVRWQLSTDRGRHWSDIRGATSLSYTTAPTTLGMSGYLYRAVFRNSAGSVTSNAARLTVNPIPFKVLVGALQWTGPSHGKYQGTVNLSITDLSGNPLSLGSIRITGVWKSARGKVLGTSTGTTDEHGVLRLSVHELSAQPTTFVVTSATKTGYTWQK